MHIILNDIVMLDAEAVHVSVGLVGQATPADLGRPTPCAGWTLRDLLSHMTAQHHGFAAASTGGAGPEPWRVRPLGDDAVSAYRTAADEVMTAFAAEGVLDKEFPLPEFSSGLMHPARRAIGYHFVDYVVHSWDVAMTLNLLLKFSPEVLETALDVARVVPGGDARLKPGTAFAPSVPWLGGSRLDQVVALLGRSPDWTQS